jgi:DNA-binding MarR family transcriptional regulator
MKPIELKFLLKLVGEPGYRSAISKLNPNKATRASERDSICRDLTRRGIVDHVREVKQFKLEAAGKALLKQDLAELPLSESQLLVLKACANKIARPGDLSQILTTDRQAVIQDMETKGLVKAEKVQIGEVWLTELGKDYLLQEYTPSGTASISFNLMGNYLQFVRKQLQSNTVSSPHQPGLSKKEIVQLLDDEAVLQKICELDQELNTDNYLPLFYLRQALQPPFSREELDQVLYRLQATDRIELSTLQEGHQYTDEQLDAGIPQPLGGALFFVIVLD